MRMQLLWAAFFFNYQHQFIFRRENDYEKDFDDCCPDGNYIERKCSEYIA